MAQKNNNSHFVTMPQNRQIQINTQCIDEIIKELILNLKTYERMEHQEYRIFPWKIVDRDRHIEEAAACEED